MKHLLPRRPLEVLLTMLFAWPGPSIAHPAIADSVLVWGSNDSGQTSMPVQAQSGVTAIAAGENHTVALKDDGSVVAWGLNDHGQTTIPIAAQSGVTAIAAGGDHTVALKGDGSVVAWGGDEFVQSIDQSSIPSFARSGVAAIAAGRNHTLALKDDGSVVAWGSSEFGQTTVPVAAQSGVTKIAAGAYHSVALKMDGSVVAWGYNDDGQRTVPLAARSGVTAIAAGRSHTVALKSDGSVVAWGWDGFGLRAIPLAAKSGVTAIAAGRYHTVALRDDGTLVAWGYNDAGQTTVPMVARSGVSAIAAGGSHTVALVISTALNITTQPVGQAVNEWQSASFTVAATGYPLNYQWRKDGMDVVGATSATYSLPFAQTNQAGSYTVVVSNPLGSVTSAPPAVLTVNPAAAGAVVAWGANHRGQLSVPASAHSGVTAIAAGGSCSFRLCDAYTVALKNDGSVVAWGNNVHGQVTGTPTPDAPYSETAIPVTLGGQVLSGVTAIAAGYGHTVALKNDGSVVSWGRQTWVPVAAQSGVTAIAAGYDHTLALKEDGSVMWWRNFDQETVPVAAQSGVTAIAAGAWHIVVLKTDGTLVAWGYGEQGQVTGTPINNPPHFAIPSSITLGGQVLSGVTAIAAGADHTVALKSDGSVVAWGGNYYGQTTVPVAAQSGVTAIAAGWDYTVALKDDGTVVAWGYNSDGQVTGIPTNEFSSFAIASPVTLGGPVLSGVTAIAAGPSHTVALIGGVPLLPSLKVRPHGNEFILSWPTNAPGYALQSTTDLTPPVIWTDSGSVPGVIGSQYTVTNTTTGGAQFHRLVKP